MQLFNFVQEQVIIIGKLLDPITQTEMPRQKCSHKEDPTRREVITVNRKII